ncbi:XapX domain-containing protein [Brevibacillus dissolubilis]|uniref:XapX domain-containing protein n=1 Tax=Brevibacillus dissolubilis TaxID=1844116 RepID=UPI002100317E|nr:DUF1427 family protein [Brevibacillus dissolubilis]
MDFMEVIKSFVVGLIVGGIVTFLKLPIPAPPALAGVMGIVGVYLGFVLVSSFWKG